MGKFTKTAGLLFLAAASVYSNQVIVAAAEKGASPAAAGDGTTDVKVLDDSTDPFASGPTTAPAAGAATSQPTEGRSVSSSEVNVSGGGTVEIHVNDANLVEVLRMLSLQSQKNIVASKDVRGTVTANLYDVTVREALDAILNANGYAYREKGSFIYVYTAKELAEIEKTERQARTDVFHVYYTPAANAATMIKPVLSPTGQVAVTTPAKAGIGSMPNGGGGNDHGGDDVLVVTDFAENLDAVKKVLAEIDRRPQQILLEATILRATLNEDNALGVDFNVMGGVDMAGIVGGSGQITNSGVNSPAGIVAPGSALPQGRVHSVGTGNSFTSPIAGGLKVGYVTDSISVFLAALEQVTDTTILANPKVLALNRQQGEVFVGNEDGYYTTLTTETTTSQSVESLKTGTRLIFRPYIGSDGYIRMEVHPEDSSGQVNANGLPSKTTTEVTSNVMVKDGHTIVIGGLFRELSTSGKSQVPFLGNLPLAGNLFRSQKDRTVREEVIILLTPHIVKDDVSYSKLSEEELRRADQLRTGVRKGMMPWGRERLAESCYEAAKKELAKPDPDRNLARWHLDSATNLNPKFSEAILLKEQITGKQVTGVDTSSIRGFLRRAIIEDLEVAPMLTPGATPATRPARTIGLSADASEAAPTTQPTAAATTEPSETEATAAAPATQPSHEETTAAAPATQPSETEATAAAPATQPIEQATVQEPISDDTADASISESAEKTKTAAETPTSQPVAEQKTVVTPLEDTSADAAAATPATQPSASTSTPTPDTRVTGVSTDEATSGEDDTSHPDN